MFNILVKYGEWGQGHDTISAGRIFEGTNEALVNRFQPRQQLDLEALRALPTLFVQETSGLGNQAARVGTIARARKNGQMVSLDYTFDPTIPPIPNALLSDAAVELDIENWQFTRTHWSVKDGDLYRVLIRILPRRRQQPTVFSLSEYDNIEPSLVSAMMPFHPSFDAVYTTLQQAAQAGGLRCRRADDIWENPAIIQDVVSLIDRSRVVICDCTGRNPNVFYEIGIAHTLGRETILITQNEADIPFDLRHLRFVRYLNNGEGLQQLSAKLQARLSSVSATTPS
jgi:hypothetical protein